MGDLAGALKAAGKEMAESPVSPERLGELVALIGKGQISDAGALGQIVDQVLAANPKQVEQYRAGKTTVPGFLAGQVMKATRGQANPGGVKQALRELRGRLPGLEAGVVARCWVGAVYEAIHHWLELPADQRLPARALAAAVAQFNLRGIGAPPFHAKTQR